MIQALFSTLSDILQPQLRRAFLLSLGAAAAVFAALWAGLGWLLAHTRLFDHWLLNDASAVLGGLAVLFFTWLLFPSVMTVILSFFVEEVLTAAEKRRYPALPAPRAVPIAETLGSTLRLTLLAVLLNILALPVYLFAPGLNLVLFYGLNGYLLGAEYFDLVAMRRLDPAAHRGLRRSRRWTIFAAGIPVAALYSVPVANLLAPLAGSVFMLHIFEGMRRRRA